MIKTAFIVLDVINGITESAQFKPYLTKYKVISKINQLLNHCRKEKHLIIFVKIGFSDLYYELGHRSPLFIHNKKNSLLKLSDNSTAFSAELDYRPQDLVVIKHRINAFYSTTLEAILNTNEINHLILAGVSTNLAVEGTARDAHDRNYKVTIASDACASNSEEHQQNALSILKMISEVKTVDEICLISN